MSEVATTTDPIDAHPPLSRRHFTRLREVYASAGWPRHDNLEIELLAAGLLARVVSDTGHETMKVSDAGVTQLARVLVQNKGARSSHEALVAHVARDMVRAGRIVWRGLALRAQVMDEALASAVWTVACPDVFSIRHTTVQAYLEPVVHEIKVSRADLLGDLKKPLKRAAYLDMGGECWYVLGNNAKAQPFAQADEIPPECGVMQLTDAGLQVVRPAPKRALERLPFHVWMALAKASPVMREDESAQGIL